MLETVQDALDAYFPDARVELRSTTELKQWLRAHVPVAIAAWMLRSRSLKVCSGISPAFAERSRAPSRATSSTSSSPWKAS